MDADQGRHCGRPECRCTHDCENGWVWTERKDRHGRTYDAVLACPTCDPSRNTTQLQAYDRTQLQYRLRARGKHTRQAAYDADRDAETRVL